jgi:hypothetical protein
MKNIRKGLSGISRFFWSPKLEVPDMLKANDRRDEQSSTESAVADQPQIKADGGSVAKPKAVAKQPHGNKALASSRSVEGKKIVDANKAADALKTALARSKIKQAEKQVAIVESGVVPVNPLKKATNKQENQPKTTVKMPEGGKKPGVSGKASGEKFVVGNKTADKKPVTTRKVPMSPTVKKSTPGKTTSVITRSDKSLQKAEKKKQSGAQVGLVIAATKTIQQQERKSHAKGTYIWVPDTGSPLARQFGLTGLPAHRLAANGDLNRTDGRWVFAPYKPGMLPSIYGLSDKIHAAGDEGLWVGAGRNWVYVFGKKQTYHALVGDAQAAKSGKTAKMAMDTADKKVTQLQKSADASAQKGGAAPQQSLKSEKRKPVKTEKNKALKQAGADGLNKGKAEGPIKMKKQSKAQPGKSQEKKAQADTSPLVKSTKTARSGNWSKVKGRWVYVPDTQPGQTGVLNAQKFAKQVEKAPVTGGWVQRNNRWVYVAPQNRKATGAVGGAKDSKSDKPVSRTDKAISGISVIQKKADQKKSQPTALATSQAISRVNSQNGFDKKDEGKSGGGKAVAGKKIPLQTSDQRPSRGVSKAKPATGLAEGPDNMLGKIDTKATSNQKTWVRKNNRWIYTNGTTGQSVGAAMATVGMKNSAEKKINGSKQMPQATRQEFLFFVPGQFPGTGSWYAAPFEMLKKARKIGNPAMMRHR